jgi:endonuclease/exonuclease/phosphatase family metal-dependent hydrolase
MIRQLLCLSLLLLASCSSSRKASVLPEKGQLKVMSYNIHIAVPPSTPGKTDIEAIVTTIRDADPDIIALQEVDVNTVRTGKVDQAAVLAEKLKMNYFFAKAIDHDGGDYGVAILSKYPISETNIHRLSTIAGTGGEARVMATAKITLKGGRAIRFAATHLDAQKDSVNREKQIAEINAIAESERLPLIIAGDFNAQPGSSVINQLDKAFSRTCRNCEPTYPMINPNITIDFIGYRPSSRFKVLSHSVIPERYASDHLPVLATLEYDF